jgi:SET domain-containing protein
LTERAEEPRTLRKPPVQANAETHTIGDKVIIRAIKNIRTGTEITYDYGRDYLTNVITRRDCKCGNEPMRTRRHPPKADEPNPTQGANAS